jgi:hypothetical protein
MGKLFFGEARIGPTCCMMLHVHMHVWVELEKQIEEKFKLNQTGKTKLVNHLSSTDRNILIRNRNFAFYPPLERLQNPLGFWYSRFFRISFGSGLKVQSCPDSSICPELTPPPTFSGHNSWTVGRMRVYLCFLERSQNSLSLPYCVFFLILWQSQSAEFCEIVGSLNQNLHPRFFHVCAGF